MRAIAKRGESVWLITEEDGEEPVHARVLDLEQLKLFPPYPTQAILERGDWEPVEEQPDLDHMLQGVDRMDGRARDDAAEPGALGGGR